MAPRPLTLLCLLLVLTGCAADVDDAPRWNASQVRILQSLSLASLDAAPPSPSNRVADNPRAIEFGAALFNDPRLSGNGELSCASCHQPERHFSDGLRRGVGVGETARNTPGIVGGAWQTWFYWDGRRDSLWSQALIPIEAANEMGGSRVAAVRLVRTDPDYRARYEALFGPFPRDLLAAQLPDQAGPFAQGAARDAWWRLARRLQESVNAVYANIGKTIAAWERTVVPRPTAFDRYVADLVTHGEDAAARHLGEDALAGAALFIDVARTQCLQCHNGPLLTNGGFHNVGSGTFSGASIDYGRMFGIQSVLMDEFNCLGRYSDAAADDCHALRFLSRDAHNPLAGAFKTPSLRNVAGTAPYMHDGRFADLAAVMNHYNAPPPADSNGGHELRPLNLTQTERAQLVAFLQALSEPPRPPATASGPAAAWSDSERALLASLSLAALAEPRPDPGNRYYAGDAATKLGAALFADTALSGNGAVACASCHMAELGLSDGRATAVGIAALRRNAIGLTGVAHRRWLYWDGRKDSLWSQALEPIEAASEMGGDRTAAARHVASDATLATLYKEAFGAPPALDSPGLPPRASPLGGADERDAWARLDAGTQDGINRVFTNLGKAIAAYERGFKFAPARFDRWLDALLANDATAGKLMNDDEMAGLRLFISGSTMCVTCHNGPRFTDGQFHNIGTGDPGSETEDSGRKTGRDKLAADAFNCATRFSDDYPDAHCIHLETMLGVEAPGLLAGSFRTPGLRGLSQTAPYMHDGRFATLEEVLRYYAEPPAYDKVPHELAQSVDLNETQIEQLAAFLRTLSERAE